MAHRLAALALAVTLSGCHNRAELAAIPDQFRGLWRGVYTEPAMVVRIDGKSIRVSSEDGSITCNAESLVAYDTGIFSKHKVLAVICDQAATDLDQEYARSLGLNAPDDYRKTYYITYPNDLGEIGLRETKWMSQGRSGTERIYEWEVDQFYRP